MALDPPVELNEEELRELEDNFERLDEMWRLYREESARVIRLWESLRIALIDNLARLSGMLSRLQAEMEELYVKAELGLVSSEKVSQRISQLETEKKRIEEELDSLRAVFRKFEEWSKKHKKNARIVGVSGVEDVATMLRRLEELKQRGAISEREYEKIKRELENILGSSTESSYEGEVKET